MAMNVCPADKVLAPVEVVWEMLLDPAGYGGFWDMTVEQVEPEGPAAAGQTFVASTRAMCKRWRIDGEVPEVDTERHKIRFRTSLPLGVNRTSTAVPRLTSGNIRRATATPARSARPR
jgi:hypothetical protein